ncbi:ParA family protein [Cedecea neteri]|uniref:ParA family protein n=1 Tax=Cedecea neteri TaxID=158822 RepID=UPI002892BB05|nr:ParA family protein [Cedecea neteri]WNJ80487.1 ParA family protein [Cedecea neteri]
MSITIYSMYNNKGGVGKTTLGFNIASQYAQDHPDTQVLVIDMCPQANISQYLLGGGHRGYTNNQTLQAQQTRGNVVGFVDWLLKGNSNFNSIRRSFKVQVSQYNASINPNLYLIAGDSFLESLTLALSYAVINPANRNAWPEFMTAIRRLCTLEFDQQRYRNLVVFIDCNPSFSIYTQMALVSSDRLIIPMMADYSSLEGLKGITTLLYGIYPTAASQTYAQNFVTFHSQIRQFNLTLPLMHRFIFNNFTTNVGVATAYNSIQNDLSQFSLGLYQQFQTIFSQSSTPVNNVDSWRRNYLSEVKDFHTSGKVSASLGIPLFKLPMQTSYNMPNGEVVNVVRARYEEARDNVRDLVATF